MGLLSMNSTRKNILDNMKLEISDSIFESATCDCDAITSTLKKYGQSITNIESQLDSLQTDITNVTDLSTDVTNIKSKIETLTTNVNSLTTEINNIKTNYATTTTTSLLDSKITTLTTTVNSLSTKLTSLETTVNSLSSKLTVLTTRVTTLEYNQPITLKVGDYVKMTPASTSYTIAAADTGCTISGYCDNGTTQTIKPSELTLWRVIRLNDTGTYDLVSVYTSSTTVEFYGATGYKKLVGTLNKIAAQYTDNKYVIKTRMMGYNGQTEEITTDLIKANSGTSSTSSSTTAAQEAKGSGDDWYTTDTTLVKNVFGTLIAYKVNATSTAAEYWLASRYYSYNGSASYSWRGRSVDSSGGISYYNLYYYNSGWISYSPAYAVRPIITLRSALYGYGSGTSSSPYVLK
jgi:prefoldin subunit 5